MEGGAENNRLKEIGIVGAGVAGAALALACRQAGLAVRLYEQHSDPSTPPRLLELSPNGTRVLHALGLKEALAEIALTPMFACARSAHTAFTLSQRPLGAFSEARYGAPAVLVEASDLRRLLWQALRDRHIPLETGVRVTDVRTESGTLLLADGREVAHAAVALAVGRPATPGEADLSALLEPRTWQVEEALTLIRARGSRTHQDREHGRYLNAWLGDGLLVAERPGAATAGGGQPVELTVLAQASPGQQPAGEALAGLLARTHPLLREMCEHWTAEYANTASAPVAGYWHAGRTVLLGGVCHGGPVWPDLSPSASLEDAWVLSRMMERWEESPHEGFADYERYRKPRAWRLRAFAATEIATQTLRDPLARWRRNLKWSLTSRFLPEMAMQKLDWLYGYDCIRGFE